VGRGVRRAAPRAPGLEHHVTALATFLSADGQQPRLVAGSHRGHVRVYDPEAGSVLHTLRGHAKRIADLACIASSSAAPHHPRLVSASDDGTARVRDGETGEMLADLRGHEGGITSVAVWKEHTGGHDRIATAGSFNIKVWDGEALTLLHDLALDYRPSGLWAFESAKGPTRLLVRLGHCGVQLWDPEEGRLLNHVVDQAEPHPLPDLHLFESAQGRHLLAITKIGGTRDRQQPGDTMTTTSLDV
jgi:WD40 repeat protein